MKKLSLFAVLAMLLLAPFASATVSEVTAEASSSSVTTGTSVTVTSTVTSTESETTSIQLVSSPSGITISDPASGSYSSVAVSTTPVTKTFTITAGSAGTYTYYAQAGSTQSTAKTIVFSDPSVLTITGDSSTVSKTSGQTFTLSISLTNSQASAVTSSYSLNLPSGYSATGDPTSSTGTSFAVGTATLSWTITAGSSSGTITFQLGSNTNAFSKSVTIPSSSSSTTTTSTSSSPGSSSASSTSKTVTVTPNDILTKITVNLKTALSSASLNVVKLASVPVAAPSEKAYQYFNITKSNFNDTNIDNATIEFAVNRSWIDSNGFNNVSLARYSNGWSKLKTDMITAGAASNTYKAYTNGFSYFAVVGEKSVAAQQPSQPETPQQPSQQPKTEQQPPQQPPPSAPQNNTSYIIVIIAIVLAAGAIGLYFAGKKGLLKMPQKSKPAQ